MWLGEKVNTNVYVLRRRALVASEYDYWLAEYSPIIPQKSITTTKDPGSG